MLSFILHLCRALVHDSPSIVEFSDVIAAHVDAQQQLFDELHRLGGLVDTVDLSWSKDQPKVSAKGARRIARAAAVAANKVAQEQAFLEEYRRLSHVYESCKPSSFSISSALKSFAAGIVFLLVSILYADGHPKSRSVQDSMVEAEFVEEVLRMNKMFDSYQPDSIFSTAKILSIKKTIQRAAHSDADSIRSMLGIVPLKSHQECSHEKTYIDEACRLACLLDTIDNDGHKFVSSICPALEPSPFNQLIAFKERKAKAEEANGFSLVGVLLPITMIFIMVLPDQVQ